MNPRHLLGLLGALLAAQLPSQSYAWIQSPVNGHFYGKTSQMSWTQAEAEAQRLGGHLATVRSAAENAWIAATFSSGLEVVWIGLNDVQTEGVFEWSSGEPVSFTNWNAGEPTNGLGIEDWVGLGLPWAGAGLFDRWNDNPDGPTSYGWPCYGLIELTTFTPASYAAFGTGCPLPSGTPALQAMPNEAPRLGTTSHLRLTGLPPVSVVIIVVGLSNTQSSGPLGSHALPRELTAFGLPGCYQYVSDESTQFVLGLAGQADWAISVPSHLSLAGLEFYVQALVPTNPLPAATSNAVVGTIGH